MKNATYIVHHNALENRFRATFHNGRVSYRNALGRVMHDSQERFLQHHTVIRETIGETRLYDLVLMAHGQVKEVILRQKPYPVCNWMKSQRKDTYGLLMITRSA